MMNSLTASHWLISVPNVEGSKRTPKERLATAMIETASKPLAGELFVCLLFFT
jgi:hypothetical protein